FGVAEETALPVEVPKRDARLGAVSVEELGCHEFRRCPLEALTIGRWLAFARYCGEQPDRAEEDTSIGVRKERRNQWPEPRCCETLEHVDRPDPNHGVGVG